MLNLRAELIEKMYQLGYHLGMEMSLNGQRILYFNKSQSRPLRVEYSEKE